MTRTNIEWTRNPEDGSKGETWPVVTGCTPVSEGCRNCYAARMAATRLRYHPRYAGLATIENGKARWTGEVRFNHDVLEQPLRWKKPRMVFVASMGDLFHDSVLEQFIFRVLKVTRDTPQHTYQILTKRPGRMAPVMREYYARLRAAYGSKAEEPQRNLWLGVSVENQAAADERIPWLLKTPAAVHYVSVEPMLGSVQVSHYLQCYNYDHANCNDENGKCTACGGEGIPNSGLDWVICGGESGPGARPMDEDWVRDLRDQCRAAGVSFFYKQKLVNGRKISMPMLDGRTWQEFPGRE